MIQRSEKWGQVEEKLSELRGLVDKKWDNGEWKVAMIGENIIRTVERAKVRAAEMRQQTSRFINNVSRIDPGC